MEAWGKLRQQGAGGRRRQVGKQLHTGSTVTSKTTGRTHSINGELNCNSSNIVYFPSCIVWRFQYVGFTNTRFRLRFNNHKSGMRAHMGLSQSFKLRHYLIYQHFHSDGHNGLEDLTLQLIGRVSMKLFCKQGGTVKTNKSYFECLW